MHTSVCCFDGLESVKHNTLIQIEFGLCRVNGLCCVNAAIRKYEMNVWLLYKVSGYVEGPSPVELSR